MKFKKLETTAAITAALLSVSPAVITPVVNASNNIDTATTQVKKTVGFSWGTVVAPTAERTTPIFTGLKSGHVKMTDKTLKDNTKIKVYYGVKLGTTTWYNIGDENYVSAKNILVNQFVPMKNGMGKQIKTTNDEAHFTHYGILTVKSASKKSVALYDANGKRTRQRVRVGSNWKFWAIKRINGQVMLRIGSQKQWIPLVYTNLLGENKKQSERNIIKGLSRGSRYIARKRAARHAIKLTKKNRAVMNGVPQIHYNTNGYREVNDSNSIQTNQTTINNSSNAADLNSVNNSNTQSSADDNLSDTNISNNNNDNTIVNNTNTDTNDSNNKQSQAGQTTNTGNNNGQNGQTAGNTQVNTGTQTTPVQPTTPTDHNKSGNAGQSSDQGQPATDNKGSQSDNQGQTSTPQKPATPVQPSGQQPTQPTKPAQPTTPVNPNHGNAGSQAGTSTDHNNSGSQQGSQTTPSTDYNNGNTGSQTGNNSGNTGKTDVQPTTPTKPTTPQQPTTPTKPSTGDNTGNQSGQQSGSTGSQSGQTTSSSQDQHGSQGGQQSGSETTPVTPDHHSGAQSSSTQTSDNPTHNTDNTGNQGSTTPAQPTKPQQPTQPSKDDNKGNIDKPVQSTTPSKDQGKTDKPATGDKDDNKGKGDNTPAQPTTPDKPVQPTKPQQPTQPTEPSKDDNKGNTDKPVQPTTPSKDQGKTDKPVAGDKDNNEGKGDNTPAKPTTPDKPVQPTEPQQPTKPSKDDNKGNTDKPVQPTTPSKDQGKTDKPVTGNKDDNKGKGDNTPAQPTTPDKPAQPTTPQQPTQPTEPSKDDNKGNTDKPVQPTTPSKDQGKTDKPVTGDKDNNKGKGDDTPAKPTTPDKPAQPTKPQQPTQPTEPSKDDNKGNTDKPVQPTTPSKDQGKTDKPATGNKDDNKGKGDTPAQPTTPDKPAQPTKPQQPTQPSKDDNKGNTDKPVQPTTPSKDQGKTDKPATGNKDDNKGKGDTPAQPTTPDKPAQPTKPQQPTQPTEPSKDDNKGNTDKPVQPTTPSKDQGKTDKPVAGDKDNNEGKGDNTPAKPTTPDKPVQPTEPQQPTKPSKDDNKGNTDKPVQPTTPSKDQGKTDKPVTGNKDDNKGKGDNTPAQPTTPDKPAQPTTPQQPTQPTEPSKDDNKGNTDKPVQPTTPSKDQGKTDKPVTGDKDNNKGKGDDTPAKPTTPDKPAQPTKPQQPTQPTEPSKDDNKGNTDKPVQPTTPSKDQGKTDKPATGNKDDNKGKGDTPAQPTTPDKPAQPTKPQQPTQPSKDDNKGNTDKPVQPTTPSKDQGKTDKPATGNKDDNKGKGDTPAQPTTPDKPAQPTKPQQPTQPSKDDNKGNTDKPVQPTTPSKDQGKTDKPVTGNKDDNKGKGDNTPAKPTTPDKPVQPTEPQQPTKPSKDDNKGNTDKPVQPTTPSKDQGNTDKPVQPTTPSKDQGKTDKPVTGNKDDNKGKGDNTPAKPTTPDKPVQPTTPQQPTKPSKDDNKGNTDKPVQPTTPSKDQGNTDKPVTGNKDDNKGKGDNTPAKPTTPDKPVQPTTPQQPTQPTEPSKDDNKGNTDKPVQPTTPSKDQGKTDKPVAGDKDNNEGKGDNTPAKPTTPDKPVQPTEPQQPTKPSKDDNKGNTDKPVQPTTPSKDQGKTDKPVTGNKDDNKGKGDNTPAQPTTPDKPAQPTTPQQPTQPTEPSKDDNKGNTDKPVQPTTPSKDQGKTDKPVTGDKDNNKGKGDDTPAKPTTPDKPAQPTKPQQPTQPTEPSKDDNKGNTDKPVQPTTPSKDQGKTDKPATGNKDDNKGKGDTPAQPTTPDKPAQPTKPQQPTQPSKDDNKGNTDKPVQPTTPSKDQGKTDKPATGNKDDNKGKGDTPAQPTTPDKPVQPTEPQQPTKPSKDDNKGNTDKPVQPTTPSKDQGNTDKPVQPTTPSKDQGKTDKPVTGNKDDNKGKGDNTPAKPTTPDKPVQPTTPQQPTKPSKDDNKGNTDKPVQPTTPSKDQGNTDKPVTGNKDDNKGKGDNTPAKPTTPDKPVQPTTPQQPTQPTEPSKDDNKGNTDKPVQPTTPSKDQGKTDKPVAGDKDNNEGKGDNTPAKPTTPDKPVQPTEPQQPTKPSKDDNKGNTDKPVQPTTPSKDQGKTDKPVTGNKDDNKGKGDNTPAQPTTPDKPAQPTKPQQPTQPTKPVVQNSTLTVSYVDNTTEKAVGSQNFTGKIGSTEKINLTLPQGYKLIDGEIVPTEYTFKNTNKPMTVKVESAKKDDKPVTPKKKTTLTINFKDIDTDTIVDNQVFTGTEGSNINISGLHIPDKYQVADHQQLPTQYTFTDKNEVKDILIKKIPDKKVVLTINYINNADNSLVRSDEFPGIAGHSVHFIGLEVPTGYKLAEGQSLPENYVMPQKDTALDIRVDKIIYTRHLTVVINDDAGNTVSTKTYIGDQGTTATLNTEIPEEHPDYYEWVGKKIPATYKFGIHDDTQVYEIKLRTTNHTINLVDPDGNVVATKTVSGKIGTSQHVTDLMPSGYVLDQNQILPTDVAMMPTNTTDTISVYKPIHYIITVVDADGNTVSTKTYTGKQETIVNIDNSIHETDPDNYEFVGNSIPATITFGKNDITKIYHIDLKKTNDTINLVDPDGNVIATKKLTGKIGSTQNVDNLLPDGYVLDAGQSIPASVQFSNKDAVQNISVYKPVHYTITVLDADGNTVSTKTYTGKQETIANIDNSIHETDPDNYEFVGNNIPATITFGKNDITKIYHIDLKKTNDTINLVDPDGNVIATKKLTGKIGSTQNVDNLLPDGYVLDAGQSIPTAVQFSNKDAVQNIAVYKPVHYTITVQDDQGNVLSTQTITGKQGTKHAIKAVSLDNTNLDDKNIADYTTDKGNLPTEITLGKTDDNITYTLSVKQAQVVLNFQENGTTIATKTVNGKLGSTIQLKPILPDGYTFPITGSYYTSYTFNQLNGSLNVPVAKKQALGTLANISVDQYYQLHGTFTGYGSVFLKDLTKDSSPENIGFNMDSSSVTDFANNSSYNLKKYAGDKVLIYVTDIMDFNGKDTSNPGSVTIDLPAPKIPAMIIDHEFTHKDNVDNNPNDYTLTLTLSGDVKDSNFSLKDANGSEYMIEPKIDSNKVSFEINENEYKAGNYITVGVKTYIDPVDSVDHSFKIDLPEFQDFENTIQDVPYNANQLYHMAWIGASGEDPKVTKQYMTGINKACYNDLMKYHYHTENLADTKEIVDPRNLTATQQAEINDFAIRLIDQARQLVKNNGATPILNDNGTVGVSIVPNQLTSASVTTRIQKLANDIATEYQNNNESIASPNSEPYTDPKTGNTTPTNGHYVAGIVRACRANGLDFDNNYVESEGGGYVYTVSSYKGHITMDNLKEQVYQDITNMVYAGGIGHVSSSQGEYGKGDGAEYGHAQAIIGVGEGYMSTHSNTEFALSFSTVPDELVGENVVALITTHYIIVGDNNKKFAGSTWED